MDRGPRLFKKKSIPLSLFPDQIQRDQLPTIPAIIPSSPWCTYCTLKPWINMNPFFLWLLLLATATQLRANTFVPKQREFFCLFLAFFVVVGIEPIALYMPSKHCVVQPHQLGLSNWAFRLVSKGFPSPMYCSSLRWSDFLSHSTAL